MPEPLQKSQSSPERSFTESPDSLDEEKTIVKHQPVAQFNPPTRPGYGTDGRGILLRTNFFALNFSPQNVQHYDVDIKPDTFPRRIQRFVIDHLIKTTGCFTDILPVYDGRRCLFSRKFFPFGKKKVDFKVTLPDVFSVDQDFNVSLKWVGTINLTNSILPVQGESWKYPIQSVYVLDAILRYLPSIVYASLGNSLFSPPNGPFDWSNFKNTNLGTGKQVWFGYHQSIRVTERNMLMNVDAAAAPFHRECSVLEYLAEVLELPVQALMEKRPLSDSQRVKFAHEVKNMKIEVTHCGKMRRKYRVLNVTRRPATTETFPWETESGYLINCTIAKYFLQKYKMELQYPHLPCLQVGKEERKVFLPIEVCNIVSGQKCVRKVTDEQTSAMIKMTAKSAPEREETIKNLVAKARFSEDQYLNEFGVTIDSEMAEIQGRVLPVPKIQLHKESCYVPLQGIWDLRGRKLYRGVEVETWALVSFAGKHQIQENELRNFSTVLRNVSADIGMPIKHQPVFCKYAVGIEQVHPLFKYLKHTFPDLQLIVILLPGKTPIYNEVKRVGDSRFGIPTQCVQINHATRPRLQSVCNLCLKINAKLGGINHILHPHTRTKVFDKSTIFIGCVVSHPQTVNDKYPSIAAVVGSMDGFPFTYATSLRLQSNRGEIVQELASCVKELLLQFYRKTTFKPSKIIYYRGGVSEGQIFNVFQYEIRAIREACMMIETGYEPGVTFISVQKRHHVRLFSSEERTRVGKAFNVPPGTIVDREITHPNEFDFYLCSHTGIQGTSRPARYHVLWDDNKMSAEALQQMSYQLCFTYARCTRSVSIPTPIYYANLVAFRARGHISDRDTADSGMGSQSSVATHESIASVRYEDVKIHPNSTMYFM